MISIKRFLEQHGKSPAAERDLVEGLMQMGRLLLDAIAVQMVRGNEADLQVLRRTSIRLVRQLDGTPSALAVAGISSHAVEASVTRLQALEKQVARAAELDDIRALRASPEESMRIERRA